MLPKLPFDILHVGQPEMLLRNSILAETTFDIGGVSLPSIAALWGVEAVVGQLTGLCLSPADLHESFVPFALSLTANSDSPRLVLGLSPPLAARLIDAALERPQLPPAPTAMSELSQGEIGALLYGIDRVGKDWIAHSGKKFIVRGVLEDTAQIADYLGHPPNTTLAAELRTGETRYPLRLWFDEAGHRLSNRQKSPNTTDALPWSVRIGLSVGWSVVHLGEISTLAPGDKIVLDTWNTPGTRGGRNAPLFWNGDWCRYGRFVSETAVEITQETERETMKPKQENTPAVHSLETAPSGDAKNLSVTVRVEVGSLKMSVEQALGLIPGRVVQLDRPVGPEVHVYVGDKHLGSGILVAVDGFMAVEIKELG